MKSTAASLFCFLLTVSWVTSMNITDDSDDSDEDDPYDRPLEIPDLTDLGLVSLDGDIVIPLNETFERKGMDFDSLTQRLRQWPNGVVSYWFGRDLTSRHRRVLKDSMKHWEDNTCLKFEPAGLFQMSHYINFRGDRSGCYSMVGRMQSILGQDLNLGRGCVSRGTAIHELGHAIGFFHEQSRSDRDKFIKILWKNMKSSMASQFAKASDNPKGVPYDYSSVMQYQEWAFQSDAEKNTIVTLDPFLQLSLGNSELSFRDRKTANAMYNCDEKCPNRGSLECENEGFLFQRHGETGDCSCVCPPNTTGDRCETLLNRSYYDYPKCGGNITSEGPIQTLNAPYTTFPDGGCVFWIQPGSSNGGNSPRALTLNERGDENSTQHSGPARLCRCRAFQEEEIACQAPQGKYPQVEFSEFNFQGRRLSPRSPLSGLRCARERVEIRTANLYEGKMFCSNDLERKNLTSSSKDLIIIATPKYSGYPGGFKGFVRFVDTPGQELTTEGASGFLGSIFG